MFFFKKKKKKKKKKTIIILFKKFLFIISACKCIIEHRNIRSHISIFMFTQRFIWYVQEKLKDIKRLNYVVSKDKIKLPLNITLNFV